MADIQRNHKSSMKHAYLIMAHGVPELLATLLRRLDDSRNDIFVHIDKKANFQRVDYAPRYSQIFYVTDRIDAAWGDFSLVEIELALIKEALKRGNYSYLHLVSGVDLPVNSQDTIHEECRRLNGKEFIGFAQNVTSDELLWRSQHKFIFPRKFQSRNLFIRGVRSIHTKLQSMTGYHRSKLEIKKGAQWWSITSDFAKYILKREDYIHKNFKGTYCPDELVFQTMCWNSPFRDNIYRIDDEFKGCRRYIPWSNGFLRPFDSSDFKEMQASDFWFARKFSQKDLTKYEQIFHD